MPRPSRRLSKIAAYDKYGKCAAKEKLMTVKTRIKAEKNANWTWTALFIKCVLSMLLVCCEMDVNDQGLTSNGRPIHMRTNDGRHKLNVPESSNPKL